MDLKNKNKQLKQGPNFKAAKLSHEALDNFVTKYNTTQYGDSIKYITASRRNYSIFGNSSPKYSVWE